MAVGLNASIDQATRINNLETETIPVPPVILGGSTDAIPIKQGLAVATTAGVNAMTLALPTAGPIAAGGDDGKILRVASITAQAHTITTPSNGIYAAKHIATFGGAIGDYAEFVAFNAQWYLTANKGCTIT